MKRLSWAVKTKIIADEGSIFATTLEIGSVKIDQHPKFNISSISVLLQTYAVD